EGSPPPDLVTLRGGHLAAHYTTAHLEKSALKIHIAPASRIIFLSQKPLLPTSLLSQHCAKLAEGNFSSFTVAGRESLPAEPSSWLVSPLAVATAESGGGTESEPETPTSLSEPTGEMPILSLRRIAPPGFLTQSFAVDESGRTS